MRKIILLLGVPIDDLNMNEALDRLGAFIENGRSTGKSHQVATVNADFVVKAMGDPELRGILLESDMATADGMPLVWGARKLGVDLEDRVTGADMVPALAKRAAQKGYSLYFLGAAPGVAARAAEILQEKNPGLKIAGIYSPPKKDLLEMDSGIVDRVRAAKPDVLLVAFGNPKQEKWIAMHRHELGVPVMIGVGGTFDFIVGKTKRAPEWMQQAGLEWVFRLAHEPRRLWKRYVVDMGGFSLFFIRQWWALRQGNSPSMLLPRTDVVMVKETAVLNLFGHLNRDNYAEFMKQGQEALQESPSLIVNMAQAEFIDSTGMGALVGLNKKASERGGEMILAAVPDGIRKPLKLVRLDRLMEICPDVETALQTLEDRRETAVSPQPTNGKWTVLNISRRLDADNAADLLMLGTKSMGDNAHIILNFSGTAFLASAGLATMGKLNALAREKEGELRLAGCTADVLRTLQLVRFDKIMPMFPNVQAAAA